MNLAPAVPMNVSFMFRNLGQDQRDFSPKYLSYSSSTRSSVSISSTGLSSRMSHDAREAQRIAAAWRPECWMESNATSSTTSGLAPSAPGHVLEVIPRNRFVYLRDLGIGEPGVGLPDVDQLARPASLTANV